MNLGGVSLGLPGALPHEYIAALAPRVEAAGFRTLWFNDTSDGDSLAAVRVAAGATSTLLLGTGVIPLDRRTPQEIAEASRDLPPERLTIGVGAGGGRLHDVAEGVAGLRELSAASIIIGGLGPKMRRLGAQAADGVLLNWLTPAAAADAVADLRNDGGGRSVLYTRTIVDQDARPALEAEAARYSGYPAYAANFERIGARAIDTTIDGSDGLVQQVARYTAVVDELVLRAVVAEHTLDAYLRFVDTVSAA